MLLKNVNLSAVSRVNHSAFLEIILELGFEPKNY